MMIGGRHQPAWSVHGVWLNRAVPSASLRRTATLALALGVALGLPGVAGATFLAPLNVTPSGADPFGNPSQIGFDRSGETTVETVSGGKILVYTRPSGGSFSGGSIGTGTTASMAVSASGAAVIAWRQSATAVQVDYRSSSAGAFASATTFSGSAVGNVAAGIDAGGNAVVAWLDGGIHYALSTGAAFGAAQSAPLGTNPTFDGRGSDNQRDHGPRAFRDDAGNVVLAYRDGAAATVAHRSPGATWTSATLTGGASTDLQAEADPTSQRLIVGYTTAAGAATTFRAFQGSTSSTSGKVVVDQPASGQNIMSVAVQRGGSVDLALWRDNTDALRSASSIDDFAPATVGPSVGAGVVGAVTSGSDLVAYYAAAPGLARSSRVPRGRWTNSPFTVSNYGSFGVGAGYNGDALAVFADFPSDTGITGFYWQGSKVAPGAAAGSASARTVSGKVLVQLPRTTTFVDLATLPTIPFGSVVDARAGTVRITTARRGGGTQAAIFYNGEFKLTQDKSKRVLETLTGGDFSKCAKGARAGRAAGSGPGHSSASSVVRQLWGNGKGKFRTHGRYGAATVRGTKWLTQDRCDGTLIRVARGTVAVSDFRRHRTVSVTAPHSYLARR